MTLLLLSFVRRASSGLATVLGLVAFAQQANAETRVVLNSVVTIHTSGECPMPAELFEVRGEIVLDAGDGFYAGVGRLTHVRHELIGSFACYEESCNLVSQEEEDGAFWAELTFDCNGEPTLLITPFYQPPIVSSGWSYSCPGMVEPLSPAWAGIFANFHDPELAETPRGQPGYSMTGFTVSTPNGVPFARKTYAFSDEDFSENTRVEIFHEPLEIRSIVPQWSETFLQGIAKQNEHTATIDWNEAGGTREVVFTLNGEEFPVANPGSAEVTEEKKSFDVGSQYRLGENTITVRATLNGECSDTLELEPRPNQRVVPPWATPAALVANDGVLYQGSLDWPSDLSDVRALDVPLISGEWGFVGGSSEVEVKALSTEAPTPGTVSGELRLGLGPIPLVTRALHGNTTGTLSDALHLTGAMTFELGRVSASKTVSVLDLVPGANTACAFPLIGELCAAFSGLGRVTGEIGGTVNLSGEFADQGAELRFTRGTARVGVDAHVTIGGGLPEPIDVAGFMVSGGGTGCVDFDLFPTLHYVSNGGRLEFHALAYAPGFSKDIPGEWPFGNGCTSAALGATTELHATDVAVAMAFDGRPALALGPSGRMAVTWSEPPTGAARPSAEIFVALHDGSAWGDAIRLTNDTLLDQRPAVMFDGHGHALVVWERHGSTAFPSEASGIPAFAAGIELEYAALDESSGNVASRGSVTTNGAFDFGPALCTTGSGTSLVWQRTPGTTLVGTSSAPASIRELVWNGSQFATSETDVSGPTSGLFGWELACHPDSGALIALSRDMDNDLASDSDREIFLYRKRLDAFGPAERLTDDAVADHIVHAAFEPGGEPVLAWLRGDAIVGRTGEPLGTRRTWVPGAAEIAPAFARGRVAASADTVLVAWPGASDIEYSSAAYPAATAFSTPRAIAAPAGVETDIELLRSPAGELALGVLSTPIVDGPSPGLAPRGTFSVSPFAPGSGGDDGGGNGGAGGRDTGTGGDAGGQGPTTGGSGNGTGGNDVGGTGTTTGGRGGSAGSDPTAGDGGTGEAGDSGSAAASGKTSKAKDGGCGCRTTPRENGSLLPLLGFVWLAWLRRSRR